MNFEDEKDYIMRMIKEMVRMLVSLVLGKPFVQVELPPENKYGISGDRLSKWKEMIDQGDINEAENMLLDSMDYTNREAVAELIFFYEYTSEKEDSFLEQYNYSREEILDGLKQLARRTGYENMMDIYLPDRD
ncbi:MAG: hypothetical protein K2O73_00170 [Lachnospiraceae bacterium]|nr:hypothetical protein [Lachnospiraceae bacterium]